MRKILSALGILIALMSVATLTINVRAEEVVEQEQTTETQENETTPTTDKEDDNSKEIIENYILPVVYAVSGVFGTLLGVLTLRKRVFDLKELVENTSGKSKEETERLKKEYDEAKEKLDEERKELSNKALSLANELESFKDMRNQITILKELVVLMVASNKELANSGYATKILELLDETEQKVVDDNENKEEV